jgi:hypothetical protein
MLQELRTKLITNMNIKLKGGSENLDSKDNKTQKEYISKFEDIIEIYNDKINHLNHFLKIKHNIIKTNEEFLNIVTKLHEESILDEKNTDNQKIILTKSE